MKFLGLVLRNAFRNRRRTILTILAIASCMFLVATLRAFLYAMEEAAISESSKFRVITQHAASLANFLPEAHRQKIEKVPGVKSVVAGYWYQGVYKDESFENWFGQMAVDTDGFREMFDDYTFDDAGYAAWLADPAGFIACEEVAAKHGWKLGQRINLRGTIFPVNAELTFRGTMKGPDRTSIYFHRKYLEEALGRPGRTGWFWIRVDDPTAVDRVTAEIDRPFENSPWPTRSMTEKQFQLQFVEMMGNVRGLLRNISLAILFTILLVAGNAVSMSIRERSTEIAVFKAIGFSPRQLLALLVAEAAIVCGLGTFLGTGGAWFLFNVMKWDANGYAQNFAVPPEGVLITAGAAAIVVLASLLPAGFAVRRPIVDGLRRVA